MITTENITPFEQQDLKASSGMSQVRFQVAIENARIEEIVFSVDTQSSERISGNLNSSKLLLLAELHGVFENASIAYSLAKRFGLQDIALEWSPAYRPVVDHFLKHGAIDFNLWPRTQGENGSSPRHENDGRMTAEYFSLLKKMKDEGILGQVILYRADSVDPTNTQLNEMQMAEIVRQHLASSSQRLLVIGGLLHVGTKPVTIPRGSGFINEGQRVTPMGNLLKSQFPEAHSAVIRYGSGQYYNMELKKVSDKELGSPQPEVRALRPEDNLEEYCVAADTSIFTLPCAHAAATPFT